VPGPVLTEVVGVGAVDDGVESAGLRHVAQPGPQLRLAEVATLRGILEVARVGELAGVHLEQRHVEAAREVHRGPPLHLGVGCTPADHGQKALGAERLPTRDGEQRGVYPAGIAEEHPSVAKQVRAQEIEWCHGQ
jgi:hypothetical protein